MEGKWKRPPNSWLLHLSWELILNLDSTLKSPEELLKYQIQSILQTHETRISSGEIQMSRVSKALLLVSIYIYDWTHQASENLPFHSIFMQWC